MESFVLNLFSDQLSKVILDFNPNTINASLLSGKGSITNLRLNVDVINEFLNKPPHGTVPFVKFTEIRLSELRVEVTSYTNLKKAPIVLVIEEIHASAIEPMEYFLDPANAQSNKSPPPKPQQTSQQQQQSTQARQAYGLLHRILDNLSIKINRIHLTFQTLGKFKTLRRGLWTPPPVSVTLENIEWISMTEAGNPGTPEAVWAHNELFAQQNRFRREGNMTLHRSYIIYKRLSMICHVRLSSEAHYNEQSVSGKDVKSAALISNTQIDVHVAYTRRLRDAGVTGIDVDVLCHDMDINLDIASLSETADGGSNSKSSGCDVGSFVHMMIGLLHCYYKDRTFVDPLLPDGVRNEANEQKDAESGVVGEADNVEMEEEEIGPDDFLPEISLVDDEDSDSDYEDEPDEEHDEAFLEWKRRHDMRKGEDGNEGSAADDGKNVPESAADDEESDKNEVEKKAYKRKRKAVIVVASGAQKFEKLSFSFSVSRICMKLFLPSHSSLKRSGHDATDRHCLELLLEGLVAECIWPKVDGEIGGHIQCSFAYVHILDLLQRLCVSSNDGESSWTSVKLFPLVKIGTRLFQGHDIFALPQHLKNGWGNEKLFTCGGVDKCEEYPSMESRQTTWTWDRPRRGKRAFGLKSTVSFVDDKLTKWSKTNVNHEACLGVVDVVLDSVPIDNMIKVFSDYNYMFDARWMSGDWTAEICSGMLATNDFHIKDYIQPLPTLYQSRGISTPSTFPSTELRSITAHLGTITIRLPNPNDGFSSFGMSDVICGFTEATIIVSSNLPKSFLSGKIMASENNHFGFPNDPTDMSCSSWAQQASSSDVSTQFRMQVSVQNFSVDIVPMYHYKENDISVVAPTNVTLMMSLEQNGINQNIIVSILLQELESNINLRQLCGALQTMNYHARNIISKRKHIVSSYDDGNIADNTDGENENATISLTVCFHMPSFNLKCWGEDSDYNDQLLLHAQSNQIELGLESVTDTVSHRNVMKVVLETFSVKICSESDMVELISIGGNTSEVLALGKIASSYSSLNETKKNNVVKSDLSLRVEHQRDGSGEEAMQSLSCAIDCTSSLALSLSLPGIEVFLKKVVGALSLPVLERSKNISIGNSTCSSIHQLCSIVSSGRDGSEAALDSDESAKNTMMRLFLSEAVIVVEISDEKSFLLLMNDSEIASGHSDKIAALDNGDFDENLLVCKQCGGSNQSWIDTYHMIDNNTNKASDIFYALGSQFTVMSILAGNNFDTLVPTNAVNYRFPVPKGEVSTASTVDVSSMKKMMSRLIKIGSSFSSSYFSLYSMMDIEDLSTTTMRFHSMVSMYHQTMQDVLSGMNAEVQSLRRGVFFKERERIGALALASSTACGWVRVGEDSSFSAARLFTSATFWRYWMVFDKSVILLYKAPGCTSPSFIIPLHERTKLRSISLSSSSNKNNTVVGNHLRQRGFSLFDELEGMELYFVTSSQVEYDSFVSAIGHHLKSFQADADYISDSMSNDLSMDINGTSDAGSSQTTRKAQVESDMAETNDLNELQTVIEATGAGEDFKHQNAEESEEMVEVQLNEDGAGEVVYNSQVHNVQSEERQVFQHEDTSSSQKATTNVSLSMRERLAAAKGKSKLATSKFGSTLKSAKLAASEMSREDIKLKGSQKMTVLKKTANTKLSSAANLGKASLMQATTAVRSSIQEQSIRTTSSDSMDKNNSFSKLDKMNKSMSGAMQRLHIDDKVSRISTAVKSVRSESQVMRQLSNELGPRRRIGIADENSDKPVKFDARDTFTAVSGHPTKVKSITQGEILATPRANSLVPADLHKFETRWRVEVSVSLPLNRDETLEEESDETKNSSVNQNHQDTKYEIILTDICNESDMHSVERSTDDLLIFHVSISELLAKTAPTRDSNQTAAFDQLHVAGSVLERLIDGKDVYSQSKSSLESIYCERVKMFISTLLETSLPRQAIEATADFLGIRGEGGRVRKMYDHNGSNLPGRSCTATAQTDDAFDTFSNALLDQQQAATSTGLLDLSNDCTGSGLFETILMAYNKATKERDTALATLAVTSVLNDHQIMQKQLARNNSNQQEQGGMQRQGTVHQSSDDEMLALCKQLGSEIAAKTSAELEINRLKEQLELERKIAREREAGLLEQLSKKE